MPSKGGRARSEAAPTAGPAVAPQPSVATPQEWESNGFAMADLSRPLRRGLEVDRFIELSAREGELSAVESDELYRSRIRRLQARLRQLERACARGDEDSIRAALEDLDGRMRELRRFEEVRNTAGLPTGYPLDLARREAAVAQLLDLASRRTPGLVAGSEVPPVRPDGEVQMRQLAFRPTPDDVPIYILAPRSIPSNAVARNIEAVAGEGARLRLAHDPSEIEGADRPPLVLNWGQRDELPPDLIALNRPEAVRIASDQVESLRRLGELAPRTVLRPQDINLLGSERVVAKQRQGARGSGKTVISATAGAEEQVRYDLFQELIADRTEYRVSLLNGDVVSAYRKRPPAGADPENLRPDWTHEQVGTLPAAVVAAARDAQQRVGLDYAGVDVIVDRGSGRAYCLEANAAPGMSTDTLRSLYSRLQRTVRRRLARAS